MNIQISTDDITDFKGEGMIVPCDSELTFKKVALVEKIIEKGRTDLLTELTAIGYCITGNAVITKGHELKVKHIIFMPISDLQDPNFRLDFTLLHQSLKAAFTLASLYKLKSLAIGGIHIPSYTKSLSESLLSSLSEERKVLTTSQIEDIIISVSKNFKNSSIKELTLYKYSK